MGNHEIECEFCGVDRRLHGNPCCKERGDYETAMAKARRDSQDSLATMLEGLGIPFRRDCYNNCVVEVEAARRLVEIREALDAPV